MQKRTKVNKYFSKIFIDIQANSFLDEILKFCYGNFRYERSIYRKNL